MALLEVRDLKTQFSTDDGVVRAVDGVSFDLDEGKTLGIVGESGSGKSVTSLSVLRLLGNAGRIAGGSIRFGGTELTTLPEREMREIRGNRISMIFQDPMTSLNPFLTVEQQLSEVLTVHRGVSRAVARKKSIEGLERVGIPDAAARVDQYPHQFSGGMRQRVMIAMALACEPRLLIADEPTTALDVTIQAQILDLIRTLQKESGTAVILITHDLGVVAGMAEEVLVMYAGRIVERAAATELFAKPSHPYTRGLLASLPRLDRAPGTALTAIPGLPPDLSNLPSGCSFAPRCSLATEKCRARYPDVVKIGAPAHTAACWEVAS
ncbi:MAG TPA: ABC transporter ATP-binding protein [bacterium]|nr:ABC transporter ATP-binding protein [bacterium]